MAPADIRAASDHMYHGLCYQESQSCIGGVCEYCAKSFKVTDSVMEQELEFTNEYEGHLSFRRFMQDGYLPIMF